MYLDDAQNLRSDAEALKQCFIEVALGSRNLEDLLDLKRGLGEKIGVEVYVSVEDGKFSLDKTRLIELAKFIDLDLIDGDDPLLKMENAFDHNDPVLIPVLDPSQRFFEG
jgi:hypothetical protein